MDHGHRPTGTRKLTFYYPSSNFTSFSVTGTSCARNCAHCEGHYLEGMIPVSSGEELLARCGEFHQRGGKGALVSGGCDTEGKIDFSPFMEALGTIAGFDGFKLNIHTGFLDRESALRLARIPFGSISMDVVGSEETLGRVYGLERPVASYHEVFRVFAEQGTVVSPHICIGLDFGKLRGEYHAVDLIAEHVDIVTKLIFIILIPTPGTGMENVSPPSAGEVLDVVRYARERIDRELIIGCMRPRDPALELGLIEVGVDGVVNPLGSTKRVMRERAAEGACELVEEDGCCSF